MFIFITYFIFYDETRNNMSLSGLLIVEVAIIVSRHAVQCFISVM